MARRPSLRFPEQLGSVLLRATDARAPIAIDAAPVSARDWELAVGSKIARRARPTKLERGVLHVRTATATWAQELSLLADTICEQLRARGMKVRSLRFQVGPVEPIARPAWRSDVRAAPEPAALPPEVLATLAGVADPELREAVARAAATMLGQAGREAVTSRRSGAPDPRSAGRRSAPQGRTTTGRRAAPRGTRGGPSTRGS